MLFIELSEMGTTILAAPAMRKARETLGAELFFVIFKKNVGSLELLQHISGGERVHHPRQFAAASGARHVFHS